MSRNRSRSLPSFLKTLEDDELPDAYRQNAGVLLSYALTMMKQVHVGSGYV